jgi:broad specificity phosphatase PhoE
MTAQAQAAMPFNIQDPYWSEVRFGNACRIKHRLILVRHGESESNIELTETGKTTEYMIDTPLTTLGQEQAEDVADFFESKGIKYDSFYTDRVKISPLWRAIQTALPTLKKSPYCDDGMLCDIEINYELREKYSKKAYWVNIPDVYRDKLDIKPRLRIENFDKKHNCIFEDDHRWLRQPETNTEFCKRVKGVMEVWKKEGTIEDRKQTIVFTHSQFISQLLTATPFQSMFFHLANGSISIIDIDEENNLHVQVANYTKHLRTPTGIHTWIF